MTEHYERTSCNHSSEKHVLEILPHFSPPPKQQLPIFPDETKNCGSVIDRFETVYKSGVVVVGGGSERYT